MIPLQFSSNDINFDYQQKGHLHSKLTVKNPNNSIVYFKFKLTRPKFYLIKPDRGLIQAQESLSIPITLHQDGVNQAENDKIKCFYTFVNKNRDDPPTGWEKDEQQTYNMRLPVIINGLPEQYKKQDEGIKSSQIKSLSNSKFQGRNSSLTTIQNSIREKESKLQNIKKQITFLKQGGSSESQLKKNQWEYVGVGIGGFLIGLVLSIWI